MTVHKSQGQTLERVIVDLESCISTESPYVMISRVKSLQGLLVMRPFGQNKIRCRQSQDSRDEARRQSVLAMQTAVCTSISGTEKSEAQRIRLNAIAPPATINTMMCAMDGLDFASALKTMKLQTVADHIDRIQVQVTKLTGGERHDTFSPPGLGHKRTVDLMINLELVGMESLSPSRTSNSGVIHGSSNTSLLTYPRQVQPSL